MCTMSKRVAEITGPAECIRMDGLAGECGMERCSGIVCFVIAVRRVVRKSSLRIADIQARVGNGYSLPCTRIPVVPYAVCIDGCIVVARADNVRCHVIHKHGRSVWLYPLHIGDVCYGIYLAGWNLCPYKTAVPGHAHGDDASGYSMYGLYYCLDIPGLEYLDRHGNRTAFVRHCKAAQGRRNLILRFVQPDPFYRYYRAHPGECRWIGCVYDKGIFRQIVEYL